MKMMNRTTFEAIPCLQKRKNNESRIKPVINEASEDDDETSGETFRPLLRRASERINKDVSNY